MKETIPVKKNESQIQSVNAPVINKHGYQGISVRPPNPGASEFQQMADNYALRKQQELDSSGKIGLKYPTSSPNDPAELEVDRKADDNINSSKFTIDSPKPGINKTGFIDIDDGANIRTRPAEIGGKTLTDQPLPPATRVFVGGQHPASAQWLYVNAFFSNLVVRGYIQKFRINTELPEPGAKLYQIKKGDNVENLSRQEFTSGVRDGHDLRFYENILLYVNRQAGRNGIHGTFQEPNLFGGGANNIQLVAGKRIWLVSPDFAKQLESIVPSGSFSGGALAKAERIYEHIKDIVQSITDSPQYFLEVAGEYAEAIYEHLPEIIATVAGFIVAESISASLAASPTGVSQLAALLIQLILALLGVQALAESLVQAVAHAVQWLKLAWAAEGNAGELAKASKEFLRMLVSIAIAALSVLGIKGNVGKSLKLANAIKIEPPGLGMSPAMATNTGQVIGGGISIYPGSITSTGPVNIGIYSSMASGPGKGVSAASKKDYKNWSDKVKLIKEAKRKSNNVTVNSLDEAIKLINEARPELKLQKAYIKPSPQAGYEIHPAEPGTNELPHIKWYDWSKGKAAGAEGHIFISGIN